ncbi:MAG: 16S rRNA (guanine(1207)-N(2))-methyltransferase RsmC [Alteromonadaceae bacterium]
MSLSNPSQILLRNSELFEANKPLLINMPGDDLIAKYLALYPSAELTSVNTNFEVYQHLKQRYQQQVNCIFTSNYQTNTKHDLVIIAFPKSKAELSYTLAMINPLLALDAQIFLVGENKSGIKSSQKLTTSLLAYCNKVDSAKHCTLFSGQFNNKYQPFNFDDWFNHYQITIADVSLTIASLPGVFSQDGLDVGTRVLLSNLPNNLSDKVLDFGCGAGIISCFIGKRYPDIHLSLLDVSALALSSAEKTLALNGLTGLIFPSNSLSEVTGKYQHIVSNPPFHQGVKTNYLATETFLKNIKKHINKNGSITIVANSFLRYQEIMDNAISKSKVLAKKSGFTIYQCLVK